MNESAWMRPETRRPNVLYLAHRVPYPPDKGDRIRSFHVLRFLSRRANVHLACFADEPVTETSVAALKAHCQELAIIPLAGMGRWARALGSFVRGRTITEGVFRSPAMNVVVRDWAKRTCFHAAVGSASSMAGYLRLQELEGVPAVIDLVDVDSQKWLDYSAARRWPLSWLFRAEGKRLRSVEAALPDWARAVTLVSEAEANLFRAFCPSNKAHAILNGVDFGYFQPASGAETSADCIFVGALDYYPNVDAALWFCREVWPEIRRRRPNARFLLVGRRPVKEIQRLARIPGVELIADVPDVRPHLAAAAVVVVPLRIARGLQNKVLEALAMGKAVVAAPPALAALQTRPGEHLLSASTPQEWVREVMSLLEDDAARARLAAAGRRFCEQHHDWDRCLERFQQLLALPDPSANDLEPCLVPTGVSA